MVEIEHDEALESIFEGIQRGIAQNLPEYRQMDSKDRSREMQKAAFGGDFKEVSPTEQSDLIELVRALRYWIVQEGEYIAEPKNASEMHDKFEISAIQDVVGYTLVYEPRPWEQSAGQFREPYRKFGVEFYDGTRLINFELNFDNTYCLKIAGDDSSIEDFEIDGLKKEHMSLQEHTVVMSTIHTVSSLAGFPE